MKKCLLMGASGFLGGHILQQAVEKWDVYAVYFRNKIDALEYRWIKLDLTHRESVMDMVKKIHPDVIIHAAANSNLDECERHPQASHAINVDATTFLAQSAQSIEARFIYVSSDMVFNGEKGYYKEEEQVVPISAYGRQKVMSENIVEGECSDWVVARAALIYGRPKFGGSSFSKWIENGLCEGNKVPLYLDQYRSPVLVNELASALLELAGNKLRGVYHLGGDERIDRYTFGKHLCAIAGYDDRLLVRSKMDDHKPDAPTSPACTNGTKPVTEALALVRPRSQRAPGASHAQIVPVSVGLGCPSF